MHNAVAIVTNFHKLIFLSGYGTSRCPNVWKLKKSNFILSLSFLMKNGIMSSEILKTYLLSKLVEDQFFAYFLYMY